MDKRHFLKRAWQQVLTTTLKNKGNSNTVTDARNNTKLSGVSRLNRNERF